MDQKGQNVLKWSKSVQKDFRRYQSVLKCTKTSQKVPKSPINENYIFNKSWPKITPFSVVILQCNALTKLNMDKCEQKRWYRAY